ncbi:MAG: hypothetical protein ABJD11_12950 [Gemmatimonadota bacterium]
MAFEYQIVPGEGIVYLVVAAPTRIEDFRTIMDLILDDPAFRTGFGFFFDRKPTAEARSIDFVRGVLSYLDAHWAQIGRCRWAVLAANLADYGMGRLQEIRSEDGPVDIRVFTDRDEALRWVRRQDQDQKRQTG